jgi:hypothetical protein
MLSEGAKIALVVVQAVVAVLVLAAAILAHGHERKLRAVLTEITRLLGVFERRRGDSTKDTSQSEPKT